MKEVYHFRCAKCNYKAQSVNPERDLCQRCSPKRELRMRHCIGCQKRVQSYRENPQCSKCRETKKEPEDPKTIRRKNLYVLKTKSDIVNHFEKDIMILFTKCRHNLLSPVDVFKIIHIYIAITDNYEKWSRLTIDLQVRFMIEWLGALIKTKSEKSRF